MEHDYNIPGYLRIKKKEIPDTIHVEELLRMEICARLSKGDEISNILRSIRDKGVEEKLISRLTKRVRLDNFIDGDFVELVERNIDKTFTKLYFALLILVLIGFFLFIVVLKHIFFLFLSAGYLVLVFMMFYKSKGLKSIIKNGKYEKSIIKNNPELIVWIKPVVTKNMFYGVIKMSEEKSIHLETSTGEGIELYINNSDDLQILIKGIKTMIPHAHFGYSNKAQEIYKKDPDKFLSTLLHLDLYVPACEGDVDNL